MLAIYRSLSVYSDEQRWLLVVTLLVLTWTTFTVSGLVAVWAGLGRTHWFLRMTVATGVIALPLLVSAYELAAIFLFQLSLTTLPLLVYRRFRRRSVPGESSADMESTLRRNQFTLRDLMLGMVLAALLLGIATRIPAIVWGDWLAIVAGVAIFSGIVLVGVRIRNTFRLRRWWLMPFLLMVSLPALPTLLLLSCAQASGLTPGESARSDWMRYLARGVLIVLAALLLFPPGIAPYQWLGRQQIPPARPLPTPNGMETLIRAGRVFYGLDIPDEADDPEAFELFVAQHRPILDEAHAALQGPCQLQLHYDRSDLDRVSMEVRCLAKAFAREGTLARWERKPTEAAGALFDAFRLGAIMQRDGFALHELLGWACDFTAITAVAEIRHELTAEHCRKWITFLGQIEKQWDSLDEAKVRELAWEDHTYPWPPLILIRLFEMTRSGVLAQTMTALDRGHKLHEARLALLKIELALQWYRLEHGQVPAMLDALAPKYLPTVPQDPFSERPLVYRMTPQGYLLYSVGPNGKDDGGKPYNFDDGSGDLVLDEPKEQSQP